jgi:hypothetical protein
MNVPPFVPTTARPACCCTSHRCLRRTGSAISVRQRWRGSTVFTTRGKARNRPTRSGRGSAHARHRGRTSPLQRGASWAPGRFAQARARRWRDVAAFLARCATDGRCEPLGDACENTQRVRSRASLAARSVALPGAAAASPCVTAQRARCGSSRVLAHGVSGAATERAAHSAFGTDSAYDAGETRRRHSPVPDRRPARESNVRSIANGFVQQTVLNARRSPPRTAPWRS